MPDRQERQEQWAVFWCSLLAPLLYGQIPEDEAGPEPRCIESGRNIARRASIVCSGAGGKIADGPGKIGKRCSNGPRN